jgi:hypothetical protein
MANDGEFKTTLKIEGDAKGAQKALSETSASLEQVARHQSGAADASDKASKKTAKGNEDAAQSFDDLAKKAGTSETAFNRFREVVSQINPGLGRMLDLVGRAPDLFQFLGSRMGLWAAGATAAIAGVAIAITTVINKLKEAQEEFARAMAANERFRQAQTQRVEETRGALAGTGLPPEVLDQAAGLSRRLQERGIEAGAADQVAAFVTSASGRELVSEPEALLLAGGAQAGLLDIPRVRRESSRERLVGGALHKLERDQERILNATLQQIDAKRRTLERAALSGSRADVEAFIQAETGLEGEALTERADTIIRQIQEGPATAIRLGGKGMRINRDSPLGNFLLDRNALKKSFDLVPIEEEDELLRNLRRRAENQADLQQELPALEGVDFSVGDAGRREIEEQTFRDMRKLGTRGWRSARSEGQHPSNVMYIHNNGVMTYDSESLRRSQAPVQRVHGD